MGCDVSLPNKLLFSVIALLLTSPEVVFAQSVPHLLSQKPNSAPDDRFPKPLPTPQPLSPSEQQPVLPTPTSPAPESAPTTPSTPISVQKIEVKGSTVLKPTEISSITQKYEGRSVTVGELQTAADAITQLYLDRGYLTSRAVLSTQTVLDGIVQIQIVEGSLERIEIQGTRRVRPAYIRSRVQLGVTKPLRADKLEDQLRLLRTDPLFESVEASLQPGTEEGKSILAVRVKEANPFIAGVSFDNYSPPSVGGERFNVLLGYRNLTGLGDELTGAYSRSFSGGSEIFDFNFRIPVNPMNGTIQLRAAPSSSRITDNDFEALGIEGNNGLYEISYRQPLIRTVNQEFALSLGFSVQDGQTFLFNNLPFAFGVGPDANGNSRTRVIRFGQDYVKRDTAGAWAFRSSFNFGVDIFDATTNAAPVPDGRFFSWLGQVQRVQRLGNANVLILQGDIQLTPDSLLPSQQFVIGGGQSLRGFRQNVRSGDNGFRISVEDRIAVVRNASGLPTLQIAPFIDFGKVWNQSDNPNRLPRQNFLAGGGIGLIWEPVPRLTMRLDGAIPFIDLDDRGGNVQEKAFYFSVGYRF